MLKKLFFPVVKGAQYLEAIEGIQKPYDLQAVYSRSPEWMSTVNNLGHFKVETCKINAFFSAVCLISTSQISSK